MHFYREKLSDQGLRPVLTCPTNWNRKKQTPEAELQRHRAWPRLGPAAGQDLRVPVTVVPAVARCNEAMRIISFVIDPTVIERMELPRTPAFGAGSATSAD